MAIRKLPPAKQQARLDKWELQAVKGTDLWKACERAVHRHPEIVDPLRPTDYPIGQYRRLLDFYYAVQGTIGWVGLVNKNVGRRDESLPFSPDNLIWVK